MWPRSGETAETDQRQKLQGARFRGRVFPVQDLHGKEHIVEDVAPGHEVGRLEDKAEIALGSGDLLAADAD